MSILLLCVVVSTTCAIGTSKLSDTDASKAITMIVAELDSRYNETRCWDSVDPSHGWLSKHRGGTTALTTLALLSAGQSSNSPNIQSALDYIWEVEEPSSYLLTLRTSIWALLPDTYERRLEKDTKRLIKTLSLQYGGWGIGAKPPQSFSSTSPLTREFGIIALREAQRRGEYIPQKCWKAIANASLATQHRDGGWSYQQSANSGDSTANMTVAGLNCLLGVDEIFGSQLSSSESTLLQNSINRGLAWLDTHATTKNSGGTALMSYLYALERVAMSCGLAKIRNRDWFIDGLRAVIESHCGVRKAKGSTVNLSFALLFVTRGYSPIALCELVQHKGQVDPHRVADTITTRISKKIERTLSWQLVTEQDSVSTWLNAPCMFIQDVQAIPQDLSMCNDYLNNGGLLVLLATGKELRRCKEFAKSLCPTIEPLETQRGHWSHDFLNDAKNVRLTIWNDGIRDRIVVIQGSGKKLVQSSNSKLSKLLTNLCCGAAELDGWNSRLHVAENQFSLKPFIIAEHGGRWDAEITAFQHRKIKSLPLAMTIQKPFVWVGGINADEVTPQLIDDMIAVSSKGATILVESIGGRGHFAATVQEQLATKCAAVVQLDPRLQQFKERRAWSIRNRTKLPPPLVISIGKGSVIIIDCDLRNALLGHTAWGVHGYTKHAAEELLQCVLCK